MREILFRGKDIKGNWHIGLLAHIGNAWYISNKAGVSTAFEVIPETVGQYTGLTDKNGKKIFEGDIVREYGGEFAQGFYEIDRKLIVEIPNTLANLILGSDCGCKYEIIGNIHDNRELLKGGAES